MAVYVGDLFLRLGGVAYYTPTFSREGLSATFVFEIFAMTGTLLVVTIEHKNIEDTAFASLTSANLGATGLHKIDASTIKEQVRIKFTVSGSNDTDAVYAQTLAPSWRPY